MKTETQNPRDKEKAIGLNNLSILFFKFFGIYSSILLTKDVSNLELCHKTLNYLFEQILSIRGTCWKKFSYLHKRSLNIFVERN